MLFVDKACERMTCSGYAMLWLYWTLLDSCKKKCTFPCSSPFSARYALQPLNVIDLVAVAPGLQYVSLRFSHDTMKTTSGELRRHTRLMSSMEVFWWHLIQGALLHAIHRSWRQGEGYHHLSSLCQPSSSREDGQQNHIRMRFNKVYYGMLRCGVHSLVIGSGTGVVRVVRLVRVFRVLMLGTIKRYQTRHVMKRPLGAGWNPTPDLQTWDAADSADTDTFQTLYDFVLFDPFRLC